MKAVVLHGPGDLRVDDIPDPDLPRGGIIVRPAFAGICGSDVRTWRHGSPRLRGRQVLGHEFAGIIAASDVTTLPVGTAVAVCPGAPCQRCRACAAGRANLCPERRVLGYDLPGAMAEAIAVPDDWIHTGGVVTLDADQSLAAGAIVEPLHTVINGQDQARIGPGDAVLVLGLGPIGVLHVAAARSRGAALVLGTDPDPDRLTAGAAILGTDAVCEASGVTARTPTGDRDGVVEPLHGFDVVIVATSARAAIAEALERVAPGGRILAFAGMSPDDRVLELDMNDLHYRQLSLVGAFGGTPATFARAAAWLATSPFDIARFTPRRFALPDAEAAFRTVADGAGLKTLLAIGDPGPAG
jgi:L-iditol 2-dehydrogenase